jgi:hypothetical protein
MGTYRIPVAHSKPDPHILLFVAIALLAVLLRLPWLHNTSLSLDEAFTLRFTDYPWSTFWHDVTEYDIHPPLYYSIVKLFRVLGDREWALRLPSFIFAVASIPLFYVSGRIIGGPERGKPLALAVTAIYCLATLQLAAAHNARSYALYAFAGAMAFSGLAWIICHIERYDAPIKGQDALKPAAIAATSAIGLALLPWAHNIGLLFAGVFGLSAFFLVFAQSRRITRGVLAILVIGSAAFVLWAPNLPALVEQVTSVSHGTWIKPVSVRELSRIILSVYGALPSTSGPLLLVGLLGSATIGLAGLIGAVRMWKAQKRLALFCLSTAFTPLLLSVFFSLMVEPVLLSRTLLPSLLPWSILVSYAIVEGPKKLKPVIASSIFLVLFFNAGIYFLTSQDEQPWVQIIRAASSAGTRKAIILTVPNSSELPLSYYNKRLNAGLTIKPIPAPFPALDKRYSYPSGQVGVPAVDESMIREIQSVIELNRDADIWVVLRGHGTYDRSNRIGALFNGKYCYRPIDTGIWYFFAFKVIRKTEVRPSRCDSNWMVR